MYSVGEYVVYKKNVCKVIKIKMIKDTSYYVLEDISDNSLKISVPSNSKLIREVVGTKEGEELINSIPMIDIINVSDKQLETEYKNLLNTGKLEDLIKIIKTTYLRNKKRLDGHKKIGETDEIYFNKAEKLLYNELSVTFDMTYDETKDYIKQKVDTLISK